VARAEAALAEDFKGITVHGKATRADLFPIFKTGISTEPIVDAARNFATLLTAEQQKTVQLEIDSNLWRSWHNMHVFLFRHGLLLDEANGIRSNAISRLECGTFETADTSARLRPHALTRSGCHLGLVRCDIRNPNNLAPLFGLSRDEFAEFRGGAEKCFTTELRKPFFDHAICENRVELDIETINDFTRRTLWDANAQP
jgi:hypothetical protein